MAPNRIMRGRFVRRALLLGAITAALTTSLGACGSSSDSTTVVQEKEEDAAVLNEILGHQLAVVTVYGEVLPVLHGADLAAAREFRAQEQEHADATTKLLRGLGADAEPAEETIETNDPKTRRDALTFLYEMESATINAELDAVGKLQLSWPRSELAAMATNQAQHLVLIRRALGAAPLETVSQAFETGETPAPEGMIEEP